MTVEQLREYLCLGSVQAIYKYEAGVGYPQADTMLALMELYGVGVNEIVQNHEGELSSPFVVAIFTKFLKKVKLKCSFPKQIFSI
jgi:transcriptional regulator with XRE-family HTH domain